MTVAVKPPIGYYGGKQYLAARIVALLPPHRLYVEPCGGLASVLLAKPPGPEVYNDVDGRLIAIFRAIRDHGDDLAWRVMWTPYSRREYLEALAVSTDPADLPEDGAALVEHARKSLIAISHTFGQMPDPKPGRWSFGAAGKRSRARQWATLPDRILLAASRMRDVQIESGTALEIIRRYDSTDTLFYVDPPYPESVRKGNVYPYEMSEVDHLDLLDCLREIRAMVLLSGYDHPAYTELEALGWHRTEWATRAWASAMATTRDRGGPMPERTEVLWRNPAALAALKGRLF